MIQADLNVILPEIVLSVYAMLALLAAVYTAKDELAGLLTWLIASTAAAESRIITLANRAKPSSMNMPPKAVTVVPPLVAI